MPSNKDLTHEDELELENGGDVKPDTKRRRKKVLEDFTKYLTDKTGLDVEYFVSDKNNEGSRDLFTETLSRYFWSYQVKGEDGSDRSPRLGTLLKVRSLLKCELIHRFKYDFTDPVLFQHDEKRWRSVVDRLGKEGLADTIHHEEIPFGTIEALYKLFNDVVLALQARGTPEYNEYLQRIPPAYHHKLHQLLQFAAQFILIMFEIRRGCENLRDLKKLDFQEVEDDTWNFRCIKKVISEQDKNHKRGTNRSETGIIPFLNITETFNPGVIFSEYLKYIPECGTLAGKPGGFLFPRARLPCKVFDVHNKDTMVLFQPNMPVGKNDISAMLPSLCQAVEKPKCTNHQIRVTAIKALRRAGYDWHTISKITGHKNPQNLVKHYDLTLEAPDLAAMSTAIGSGPAMLQGDKFSPPELATRGERTSRPVYLGARTQEHQETDGRVRRSTFTFRNDFTEDNFEISASDDDKDISSCESEDEYKPTESAEDSDTDDEEDVSRKKRRSGVCMKRNVSGSSQVQPVQKLPVVACKPGEAFDPAREERLRKQKEKQAKFQQEMRQRNLQKHQHVVLEDEEESQSQMQAMDMMLRPGGSCEQFVSPKRRKSSGDTSAVKKSGLEADGHKSSREVFPSLDRSQAESSGNQTDQFVSTPSPLCVVGSPALPDVPQTFPNYQSMHQMVQLALQSQREQAEAMHLQSLQAQSQFFLKLQAQLASQAATTGPGPQAEAVQASQITFTQRVETTYSKSPEKLNQEQP